VERFSLPSAWVTLALVRPGNRTRKKKLKLGKNPVKAKGSVVSPSRYGKIAKITIMRRSRHAHYHHFERIF
jgi:hypothetical protein